MKKQVSSLVALLLALTTSKALAQISRTATVQRLLTSNAVTPGMPSYIGAYANRDLTRLRQGKTVEDEQDFERFLALNSEMNRAFLIMRAL